MVKKSPTFLAKPDTLQQVKQSVIQGDAFFQTSLGELIQAAEAKLTVPPQSIVRKKKLPPSGDAHDYMSLAPYWWPNQDTVDGLPYVRRDGEVNPERWRYDVTPLQEMTEALRALTFAYFFTGDERYSDHAAQLLRTWFINPTMRMNPNLEFAQFVPGLPLKKNKGHGIIETVRFRWLIDGLGLLEHSASWTESDAVSLRHWFSEYRHWLLSSTSGQQQAQSQNNKASWYAMQVALYSLFVGDLAEAMRWVEEAKNIMTVQIMPDGSQPMELQRTRSWHYSMYNLQALFDLACLGAHVGVDLFKFETPDGRSLRRALDFLIPFAIGQKKWPYPQIDEPFWYMMAELLRRAAVHFKEPRYEEYIQQLSAHPLEKVDVSGIGTWLDLVEPPLHSR